MPGYNGKFGRKIIKMVAEENKYSTSRGKKSFTIEIDKYHSVAFRIVEGAEGYLKVHQWEESENGESGKYGRAIYSLRNISDVIKFCDILIKSPVIRAKRYE